MAQSAGSEARFEAYMNGLVEVIGHADRATPLTEYCTGLLMPIKRKSVEPMAAIMAPAHVSAKHQSLLHFVGKSPWSDNDVLARVRQMVLPCLERHGPIRAWIIDDTGIPKKGRHSVGVKRQYCGEVGKRENCQVGVSLSVANDTASLPIAYRLFLPKEWAEDPALREKAGIPRDIGFQTKGEIALAQIKAAQDAGITPGVVLADAGYGNSTSLRTAVTGLGLSYVMGVQGNVGVWPPGSGPLLPTGKGRRANIRLRRDADHQPVSAKDLAQSLAADDWHQVTWRQGTNAALVSRFAAVRVRPANADHKRSEPRAVEWLLIEWPRGEGEPTKYWLSSLPRDTGLKDLVDIAKLRWRIERDYQDLKQEIGLGHYEGRGWRGFHHHATLAIAAYGFLICEAEAVPPSGRRYRQTASVKRQMPELPDSYNTPGATHPPRTPRTQFNRHRAQADHSAHGKGATAMSVLSTTQK